MAGRHFIVWKKAWRQLAMTCKWNKARPIWPKTISFTRHCGQSARHGGKLPPLNSRHVAVTVYFTLFVRRVSTSQSGRITANIFIRRRPKDNVAVTPTVCGARKIRWNTKFAKILDWFHANSLYMLQWRKYTTFKALGRVYCANY